MVFRTAEGFRGQATARLTGYRNCVDRRFRRQIAQ
jgi:hypothetical protein